MRPTLKKWKLSEGATVFEPPEMDAAIIGTFTRPEGTVAVYDYDKVIDIVAADGSGRESAEEWVDYNTLRTVPYMGKLRPFVVAKEEEPDEDNGAVMLIDGERYLIMEG